MIKTILAGVGIVLAVFVVFCIIAVVIGFPVMWLWNYALVGTIVGVAPLTFWKAVCLTILTSILFKSTSSSSKS